MSNYRRAHVPGGTFFFTAVTYGRRPILTTPAGRDALHAAIEIARAECPFQLDAIVLLPDHTHTIWTLPADNTDFGIRWKRIKREFTVRFLAGGGQESEQSASRQRRGERGVWQRRFWEHAVRDEDDLKRCLDYLHYNPVKHGLVGRVVDWPWSTFHQWVGRGEYEPAWGIGYVCPDVPGAEWE